MARSVCWRAGRSRAPAASAAGRPARPAAPAAPRGGEEPDARRGQLDGQRQPVQPRADRRHRRRWRRVSAKSGSHGLRPLRRRARTAAYCVEAAPGGPAPWSRLGAAAPAAARRYSCSPRTRSAARLVTSTFSPGQAAEQLGHDRRRVGHLLEVVQHQQQLPSASVATIAAQRVRPLPLPAAPSAWAMADEHQRGIAQRGQRHEDTRRRGNASPALRGDAAGPGGSCRRRPARSASAGAPPPGKQVEHAAVSGSRPIKVVRLPGNGAGRDGAVNGAGGAGAELAGAASRRGTAAPGRRARPRSVRARSPAGGRCAGRGVAARRAPAPNPLGGERRRARPGPPGSAPPPPDIVAIAPEGRGLSHAFPHPSTQARCSILALEW